MIIFFVTNSNSELLKRQGKDFLIEYRFFLTKKAVAKYLDVPYSTFNRKYPNVEVVPSVTIEERKVEK